MEIAKVTSKGQITIPIDIRKRFGFQEGNKVLFVEDGNRVYLMNSTMNALKEAQKAFEGEAEKAESEEVVSDSADESRGRSHEGVSTS